MEGTEETGEMDEMGNLEEIVQDPDRDLDQVQEEEVTKER